MQKKILAVALFTFFVIAAFGQPIRKQVGVFGFSPIEISRSDAETVTGLFSSELVSAGEFDVVDRANIQRILKEVELQQSGLTDAYKAVKVGRILALEYMVTGTISRLGSAIVVNVQLTNVETSRIEKTSIQRFSDIESSIDGLKSAAYEISGKSNPAMASAVSNEVRIVLPQNPPALDGAEEASSKRASAVYLEPSVGALFLLNDSYSGRLNFGNGFEAGVNIRYMLADHFGAAFGVLFGFSDDITIGASGYLMFYLDDYIGLGMGFQGSPNYLNYFGGPSAYVALGNLSFRMATNILGSVPSTSFGVLYLIKI